MYRFHQENLKPPAKINPKNESNARELKLSILIISIELSLVSAPLSRVLEVKEKNRRAFICLTWNIRLTLGMILFQTRQAL